MQGKLTAKNTDFWSRCFPPCMVQLYKQLQAKHHLKHSGRLQLGLFLKGAGLPLDEALIFWKGMFEGSGKNFEKEYLYNIKHSYGKEGAKKNYSPMGCEMIIRSSDPKAGEYHGCPFKSTGPNDLRLLLRGHYRLGEEGQLQVEELYLKKHYQAACQLLFRLAHPGLPDARVNRVGTHPNLFFE
jgi:DNA primase large subunit